MATKPTNAGFDFASSPSYVGGAANKIDVNTTGLATVGYIPGNTLGGQPTNDALNRCGKWSRWLEAGSSSSNGEARPLESNSKGGLGIVVANNALVGEGFTISFLSGQTAMVPAIQVFRQPADLAPFATLNNATALPAVSSVQVGWIGMWRNALYVSQLDGTLDQVMTYHRAPRSVNRNLEQIGPIENGEENIVVQVDSQPYYRGGLVRALCHITIINTTSDPRTEVLNSNIELQISTAANPSFNRPTNVNVRQLNAFKPDNLTANAVIASGTYLAEFEADGAPTGVVATDMDIRVVITSQNSSPDSIEVEGIIELESIPNTPS